MDNILPLLVIVLGIGILIGIIVWMMQRHKKLNKLKHIFYSEFADKHKLSHRSDKYMMAMLNTVQGNWNGYPFAVFEEMQGSGNSKQIYTYAVFENVRFDFNFKIGKEHIFSKTEKLLGLKGIEFGDTEFDKKFLIKANDEDKFRAFFNQHLQDELKSIKNDLVSSIRLDNGVLSYYHYGPLLNEKKFHSFEQVISFMMKLIEEHEKKS